jgi:uncharacterized protein YjbI with pentapeptide repeats
MAKEQEVAMAERLAAEGGIASDESAVAEPEIEADEGSAEEPEIEPVESAAAEGNRVEEGCPIEMGICGPRCGRHLHNALYGSDEKPVCLMHSKDPRKQSGPLFEAFRREFERILEEARDGEAHFERFVFPLFNFIGRIFQAVCRFEEAIFAHGASFYSATFTQKAIFWKVTFSMRAEFRGVTFTQDAYFNEATFMQQVNFVGTAFKQDGDFIETTFMQDANFREATFMRDAYFGSVIFTQAARFVDTEFRGKADWVKSRFLDRAEFRRTKFNPQIEGEPSAVFELASFSKPSEIVFDDVDLSRSLFHNCDVSQLWFTSSVRWGTRKGNRGLAVFEETIDLEQNYAWGLKRDRQRDYRAVAQIYQQLKKNYDSRLDYWTANEFHFGEMEMKRLAGPTDGWFLRQRQWWHCNLSFVAWYKYASDYGNSYGKPLVWLLGTLLAAALLFPITGLELKQAISASSASVTYSSIWNPQDSWTNNFWTEAKLIGKSGITAIDTATFQRTPEYTPVYPRGRVVAIVETLLTSSLFALFLLAIRRQFRR